MRLALPLIALAAACNAAPLPPPRRAPSPPPPAATAAPAAVAAAGPDSFLFRAPLAGCTDEALQASRARVKRLDDQLRRYRDANAVEASTLAELQALWEEPCFAHVARFSRAPASTEGLRELWVDGLGGTLLSMAGGLYVRDGKRYFVIPPERASAVAAKDVAPLAAWLCAPPLAGCGHAASFVQRAEHAFDEGEEKSHFWRGPLVGGNAGLPNINLAQRQECEPDSGDDEATASSGKTAFERFLLCSISTAPGSWRYPRAPSLRARDHGWLVLRGRRGHYSFADEIRAYDLATGAAYVARSASALVLAGGGVDGAAVDAKRKPDVLAGAVSAEQVRELAFVLATDSLLRPTRTGVSIVVVPEAVPVALSGPSSHRGTLEIPPNMWSSSGHTRIAWELRDGPGTTAVAAGDLMWPSSWKPGENHADHLLEVLEAGLERGCPPAKLPPGLVRGRTGALHPADGNADDEKSVMHDLAGRLESTAFCAR